MSSSRISRSLPGLWVAITSRPEIGRRASAGLLVNVRDSATAGHLSNASAPLPLPLQVVSADPAVAGCEAKKSRSHHCHFLQVDELRHALLREREQVEELFLGERNFLGGALHLDDPSGAGHDEIGVG